MAAICSFDETHVEAICSSSDVAKEITIAQEVVSDWNIQHGELRKRKLAKTCPHPAHLDPTLLSVVRVNRLAPTVRAACGQERRDELFGCSFCDEVPEAAEARVSSRIIARAVAAEVTRRKCFSSQNPPPYVGGYNS